MSAKEIGGGVLSTIAAMKMKCFLIAIGIGFKRFGGANAGFSVILVKS